MFYQVSTVHKRNAVAVLALYIYSYLAHTLLSWVHLNDKPLKVLQLASVQRSHDAQRLMPCNKRLSSAFFCVCVCVLSLCSRGIVRLCYTPVFCFASQRNHWYLNKTLAIDQRDRSELGPIAQSQQLKGGWYGAKNGGFAV